MKRFLEDHLMASVRPGEYFSPDEVEIVLEALAWYKGDPVRQEDLSTLRLDR